jgi:hypothetical protein
MSEWNLIFIFLNFLLAGGFYPGEFLTKTKVPLTAGQRPDEIEKSNSQPKT